MSRTVTARVLAVRGHAAMLRPLGGATLWVHLGRLAAEDADRIALAAVGETVAIDLPERAVLMESAS